MKQSSLDEPLMGMEFEGGEGGNNSSNNEGDGDMMMFMDQSSLSQYQGYFEDQNNQAQPRPSTPQPIINKGIQIGGFIFESFIKYVKFIFF